MKIALSGYNGLLGAAVENELRLEGHEVVRLNRAALYDNQGSVLSPLLQGTGAVIHLAGAPILKRWTPKNRKAMYDSRIITTQNLVNAIRALPVQDCPGSFVSASAIGIYQAGKTHTESSDDFAGHFAAQLTKDWELASEGLPDHVRRVIFRIGLVLDSDAKLISLLRLPFLLYAGGPLASGKQAFPFVHLQDVTRAIQWSIRNQESRGMYNLSAPGQTDNKTFSREFGRRLNRPSWLHVPVFPLKIFYGQAAQLVYESPSAIPERLLKEGFVFRYPDIGTALDEVMHD